MGGWWSGPPKRWRGTVEEARSLDVLRLSREGMLASSGGLWSWRWTSGRDGRELASIGIATGGRGDGTSIRLFYTSTPDGEAPVNRDYEVAIERTPCTYGGSRPWFRCSRCNRRSRFLYLSGGTFVCRLCARLTYWTRRIHRDKGYESGWIEKQIEKVMPRMFRARSEKKRNALRARLERLGGRRNSIWAAIGKQFGIGQ